MRQARKAAPSRSGKRALSSGGAKGTRTPHPLLAKWRDEGSGGSHGLRARLIRSATGADRRDRLLRGPGLLAFNEGSASVLGGEASSAPTTDERRPAAKEANLGVRPSDPSGPGGRRAKMAAPRTLAPIRAGGGTVHRLSPRSCGTRLAALAGLRGGQLSCD